MPELPVLGWHRPKRRERFVPRLYPAPRAPALKSVIHQHGPVLNQGSIGACSGNDVADNLNCASLHAADEPYLTEADALHVYEIATRLDDIPGSYPPDDTGSTNIAAAKAAVRLGLASGWSHTADFGHFLAALVLQPMMWASDWTEQMFTASPSGQVRPDGAVQGGHSYAAIGLDVENRRVVFLNSWGPGWGLGGCFWMSWSDAEALWVDGEVIALHAGPTTNRQRAPRGCL